jgi:hypothetical protein
LNARIRQGADIAHIKNFRITFSPLGVVVGQLQGLNAGHVHDSDFKLRAAHACAGHVVGHVLLHGKESEFKTGRAANHGHILPVATGFAHMDHGVIGIEAFGHCHDAQIGATSHTLIAGGHFNGLRWQQVVKSPTGQ